jgi:hypothetical protein
LIAAFLDKSEARVMRRVKGIGKVIDVRRLVTSLRIGGYDASERLARAGIVGRAVPLEVSIAISQSGSAKIGELLEAVLGDGSFPHVALRVELTRSELAQKNALDPVISALG